MRPKLAGMSETPTRRKALTLGTGAMLALPLGACWSPNSESGAPLAERRLPPVDGIADASGKPLPGVDTGAQRGRITVLNIWATWCPSCRSEREMIASLANDSRYDLAGLAWRDDPERVRAYLAAIGNPYASLSLDDGAFAQKALGLRGVPTTLIVGRDGRIVKRMVGPIDANRSRLEFRPAIKTALEEIKQG